MNGEQRNQRAAMLLILAACVWLVQWIPAGFITAFLLWVVVHKRLEGDVGAVLRRWRRVWPPAPLVLVPLLLAATLGFWGSERSVAAKVLPIALNVFALSLIFFGSWWRVFAATAKARVR